MKRVQSADPREVDAGAMQWSEPKPPETPESGVWSRPAVCGGGPPGRAVVRSAGPDAQARASSPKPGARLALAGDRSLPGGEVITPSTLKPAGAGSLPEANPRHAPG
jgi:hypothetical protein